MWNRNKGWSPHVYRIPFQKVIISNFKKFSALAVMMDLNKVSPPWTNWALSCHIHPPPHWARPSYACFPGSVMTFSEVRKWSRNCNSYCFILAHESKCKTRQSLILQVLTVKWIQMNCEMPFFFYQILATFGDFAFHTVNLWGSYVWLFSEPLENPQIIRLEKIYR